MNKDFLNTILELKDMWKFELVKYNNKDAIVVYISYENPDYPGEYLDYPLLFIDKNSTGIISANIFKKLLDTSIINCIENYVIGLFVNNSITQIVNFNWDDVEDR